MPKISLKDAPARKGAIYPGALAKIIEGRQKHALGDAGGLTQFGVNLTYLNPGSASAHRHWHKNEDEFIYILEGEAVLIEDDSETLLQKGDAASFPAGIANGHHLINRSNQVVVLLEVGTRSLHEEVIYTDPDVDMKVVKIDGNWHVQKQDGTPY